MTVWMKNQGKELPNALIAVHDIGTVISFLMLLARSINKGYTNVKMLKKGINGWIESGFCMIE